MANHTLAISVTVAAFVICGAFLLAATTFLTQTQTEAPATRVHAPGPDKLQLQIQPNTLSEQTDTAEPSESQIPYEKNKKIEFLGHSRVAAIRADGHYTHLYTREGVLFCPWSITEAEKKLAEFSFHRTHRSYLVNIDAIDMFEKRKETGVCLFSDYPQLSSVPVSRNRVIGLASVLGSHRNSADGQSAHTAGI